MNTKNPLVGQSESDNKVEKELGKQLIKKVNSQLFVCHCLPGPWLWRARKSKQISPGKTNKIISYFGNVAAHRYFCSVCFENNCETYQTTNSMKINFALLLSGDIVK